MSLSLENIGQFLDLSLTTIQQWALAVIFYVRFLLKDFH